MHDFAHRFAVAALIACGALTALMLPWDPQARDLGAYLANPFGAWAMLQTEHRHFLVALLGAALVLSAFVPALRLAAIGGSILSKVGYLALSLGAASPGAGLSAAAWLDAVMALALALAAAVFAHEAWQDARWHSVRVLRPEA